MLPWPLQPWLEAGLARLLLPGQQRKEDFLDPRAEPALIAPESVSWRVFKNPVVLFIGGVTAVLLELAEPRVRSGIWQHTSFRELPLERLQRTGYAAMMTVYGARSRAEAMIADVARKHARVRGVAPDGRVYSAADPVLLEWVHATACFGFLNAYHAFVRPLTRSQQDRFYAEAQPVATLYGAVSAPATTAALESLFDRMSAQLERSDIVLEFLRIMSDLAILPLPLRRLQGMSIRAAVQNVPGVIRARIGLGPDWDLPAWQRRLVCGAGAVADRLLVVGSPAVQACRRLGLADDYLYYGD